MIFSYRLLGFFWVTACWNRIDYWIEVCFFLFFLCVQSVSPKSHQHTNVHYETVNVLYQCKVTFSYWASLTPFQIYLSSLNCKQTLKERKLYTPSCHNSHIESVLICPTFGLNFLHYPINEARMSRFLADLVLPGHIAEKAGSLRVELSIHPASVSRSPQLHCALQTKGQHFRASNISTAFLSDAFYSNACLPQK